MAIKKLASALRGMKEFEDQINRAMVAMDIEDANRIIIGSTTFNKEGWWRKEEQGWRVVTKALWADFREGGRDEKHGHSGSQVVPAREKVAERTQAVPAREKVVERSQVVPAKDEVAVRTQVVLATGKAEESSEAVPPMEKGKISPKAVPLEKGESTQREIRSGK